MTIACGTFGTILIPFGSITTAFGAIGLCPTDESTVISGGSIAKDDGEARRKKERITLQNNNGIIAILFAL